MASQIGDGDYLAAYRRFFVDFLGKVNPDDQLPIKTGGHDVTEGEIVGEIIHMTLQYLDQQLCPPSLQCYIAQLVIEEIKSTCRKQPETCGFRQEDKTYAPLKLMQAVTGKVNEICQRYLENSRLALLPPPPSTPMPLATAFAIRNNRRKMEDRHVILHDLNTIFNIKDDSIASYYAVFDGHAGYQAAVFCATHLHQYLAESRHYPTDPERALRDAFLTTDARFIDKSTRQTLSSGTTAVCALILNRKLYVAWAGDSQAALAKRGVVTQLVNPHKPDRNDERERVEEMGGTVMHLGIWRVNGNLAVSRAIGDAQYKPYVTGDPEIRCITLDGQEDFLIIACDGLWDCVTEDEAATLVYRHLYWEPYDYGSTSQRLVEYAKNQGSIDNITVIVVFLATPRQIASRSTYGNPLLADVQMNNMEPDNRYLSNANGQYEVNSTFGKQQPPPNNGSSSDMTMEDQYGNYGKKSSNGKSHENGDEQVADYDVEEEDEEEEEEDDDDDLGPETDVDAVDDVSEPVAASLADVSRQLFTDKPDPSELYRNDECMDDDSPPSPNLATESHKESVNPDADNVADSEDSEDEWNYYRIDPNKEKADGEEAGAAGFSPVPKTEDELVANVAPAEPEEHEEKSFETPNNAEGDSSSDSEDSAREIRTNVLADSEISASSNPFEPSSVRKEVGSESEEEKADDHMEKKIQDEEGKKEGEEGSIMDFQLNPNAAEFVPVSPTLTIPMRIGNDVVSPGSPLKETPLMNDMTLPVRMCHDKLIAGSPLKQTPPMDDILIPSKCDFEKEIRDRPHEIEEKSCANGGLFENSDDTSASETDNAAAVDEASAVNLDESEVSSTRAEFGDESSFLMGSEFYKTGASNFEPSFTGSYGEFDNSAAVDPMTKSFGPGEFVALSDPVDLNAVHDLTDADLMIDGDESQQVTQPADSLVDQCQKVVQNNCRNDEIDTEFEIQNQSNSMPVGEEFPTSEITSNYEFQEHALIPDSDSDLSDAKVSPVEPEVEDTVETTEPRFDDFEPKEQTPAPILEPQVEKDVSSKLLEMDLEDRGSQDCGFEKCNEKWQNDLEECEFTPAQSKEDPAPRSSSPLLDFNATGESNDFLEDRSVEMPKTEESHDLTKDTEFHDDFCTKEETVSVQVSIMQNPLDLDLVTSSSAGHDNSILEDDSYRNDCATPKAPASPEVAVSPLIDERPINSFHQMDLVNLSQQQQQQLLEQEEKEEAERVPLAEEHFSEQKSLLEDESPLECVNTEERADVSEGLKLSESLQEFTGLEQQLNPDKVSNGLLETHDNLMDVCNDETKDTPVVPIPAISSEEIEKKMSELTVESELAEEIKSVEEKPESTEKASSDDVVLEAVAAAAAVATVGAASVVAAATAAAATAPAPKATKAKPAGKVAPKVGSAAKSTIGANKSTPTSPTKPSTARTSTAVGAAKKTGATLTARPNKLEPTGKTAVSPSAKSSAALSAKTAAKPTKPTTGRPLTTTTAAATGAKAKSLTSTTKSTAAGEKKPTSNGDATKSSLSTTSRVTATNTRLSGTTKTLKASTGASSKSNGTATTTTSTSSRPKTTSTTATASSRLTSKTSTTTGTTGTTTQRPKTAPSTGTLAASSHTTKSRLTSSAKSPITEKQIKETANKQISSSRTTTTTTSSKTSRVSGNSSTTTARRLTSTKTTGSSTANTNNAAPPAMPPPIKKPGSVARSAAVPSKPAAPATNGKINSAKTNSTTINKTKVVVENGVCTAEQDVLVVTSTTATTTTTTNNSNEEDVPKKDISPIETSTDNQLIVTAD